MGCLLLGALLLRFARFRLCPFASDAPSFRSPGCHLSTLLPRCLRTLRASCERADARRCLSIPRRAPREVGAKLARTSLAYRLAFALCCCIKPLQFPSFSFFLRATVFLIFSLRAFSFLFAILFVSISFLFRCRALFLILLSAITVRK